jgi:hypothetical protein
MGRFGTALIISLALGGATLEGISAHAQNASAPAMTPAAPADPAARLAPPAGSPVEMILADAALPGDQDAPPPPPPGGPAMAGPGWGAGPNMGPGGMHRPPPPFMMMMHHLRHEQATWGLLFPQKDKNLSTADVQVLAQAILLSKGNHDWKVANVAADAEGKIGFDYATASGDIVAKFTIDPHSGRIARNG